MRSDDPGASISGEPPGMPRGLDGTDDNAPGSRSSCVERSSESRLTNARS